MPTRDASLPFVVSASADIAYLAFLMSRSRAYRALRLDDLMDLVERALEDDTLRVYCDTTGQPIGCVIWQRVEDGGEGASPALAEATEGDVIVTHFAAPFGQGRMIVNDLFENVVPEGRDIWRLPDPEPKPQLNGATHGVCCATGRKLRRLKQRRTAHAPTDTDNGIKWAALTCLEETTAPLLELAPALWDDASDNPLGAVIDSLTAGRATPLVLGPRTSRLSATLVARASGRPVLFSPAPADVLSAHSDQGRLSSVRYQHAEMNRLPLEEASERSILAVDMAGDLEAWRDCAAEIARIATSDAAVFVCVTLSDAELQWPLNAAIRSDRAAFEAATRSTGLEPELIGDCTALQRHSDATVANTLEASEPPAGDRETPRSFLARAFRARIDAIEAGRLRRLVYRLRPVAPARVSRRQRSLVMLSGGIDSVYTLWMLLTGTDDDVYAHHLNMVNDERRYVVEARRCREIVSYLERTVRPLHYSESTIDRREFSFYGYDVMTVAAEMSLVANSTRFNSGRAIDRWTIGACTEEGGWPTRWRHVEAAAAATAFPFEPPEFFMLPLVTKQQEIDALPDELVSLTWGCRRPVQVDGQYLACGSCSTCLLFATHTALDERVREVSL